jgi:hypothetical protein
MTMKLWNVPCPGCGVTTSVALAARGRLLASFENQPFGLLVALFLAGFAVWAPVAHILGRDLWQDLLSVRADRWGPILILIALLAWVYKLALVRGWFS